jgi:hypothetical protein
MPKDQQQIMLLPCLEKGASLVTAVGLVFFWNNNFQGLGHSAVAQVFLAY